MSGRSYMDGVRDYGLSFRVDFQHGLAARAFDVEHRSRRGALCHRAFCHRTMVANTEAASHEPYHGAANAGLRAGEKWE